MVVTTGLKRPVVKGVCVVCWQERLSEHTHTWTFVHPWRTVISPRVLLLLDPLHKPHPQQVHVSVRRIFLF